MTKRTARCACGKCTVRVAGKPALNAVCHCDNCRQRTGSAFGWQVYFPAARFEKLEGEFDEYHIRDEQVRSFCSHCGTTLFWTTVSIPDHIGLAGGAFTEAPLPQPDTEAAASQRSDWVSFESKLKAIS